MTTNFRLMYDDIQNLAFIYAKEKLSRFMDCEDTHDQNPEDIETAELEFLLKTYLNACKKISAIDHQIFPSM